MTKDKTVPLLWKVLANKYRGQLEFGTHRDRKGKSSVVLGLEAGEKKESKVLIYSPGSTTPFRYEGLPFPNQFIYCVIHLCDQVSTSSIH